MSESTQDRRDEADEQAPKPGEPDTESGRSTEEVARIQGRRAGVEAERVAGSCRTPRPGAVLRLEVRSALRRCAVAFPNSA